MTTLDSTMMRKSLAPTYRDATSSFIRLKSEPNSLISHLHSVESSDLGVELGLNTGGRVIETSLLASPLPEIIEYKAKLIPYYKNICNAKDYVFLGSCDMTISSDMGITLDQNGQLILIKGFCRNLAQNWYAKYQNKQNHSFFLIDSSQQETSLIFETLYLDAEGKLTGKVQDSHCLYTINIETHISNHSHEEGGNIICLSFTNKKECNENENRNFFSYLDKNGKFVRLELKNENIYLQQYGNSDAPYDYKVMGYQLKLSLDNKYKISSIKPAKNKIQLETTYKNKKRIFYLDPLDISISRLKARGITHKPPQSLITSIGGDIHKISHSGQPYSSRCKAHFSSRHIPIVSGAINNFRFHIKKTKQYHCRRKRKKMASHLLKSVDPGARAIISTTKNLKNRIIKPQGNNKSSIIQTNMINLRHYYASLFKEIPDIITPGTSFSEALTILLSKTKPNDIITFSHESHFSAFINLLHTGAPITHGWFAGLMLSMTKSHSVQLSRTDQDDIRIFFVARKKKNIGILVGTGQGFESSKIHSGNINFLSVMPFEANLILSAYQNEEMNISFTMTKENFTQFIEQKGIPHLSNEVRNHFLDTAIVNVTNEKQGSLSVDMKISELRAMIGIQPTDNLTCLLPRVSGGLSCNTELFALTSKTVQMTSENRQVSKPQQETKLKMLSASLGTTGGVKLIMNPSISEGDGKLNFRTALIEDNQSYKRKTKSLIEIALSKKTDPSTTNEKSPNHEYIKNMERKLAKIKPALSLCRSIKYLNRIRFSRPLRNSALPFPVKLVNRCLGRKPMTEQGFSNAFKGKRDGADFSAMMKTIQQDALNQERSGVNKSKRFFFNANYELNEISRIELSKLQGMLATLIANQQSMSTDAQRVELEHLHQRIIQLHITARYRLRTIKINAIGTLAKTQATLINVFFNFYTTKSLAYTQALGTLTFDYRNKTDVLPDGIRGDHYVI